MEKQEQPSQQALEEAAPDMYAALSALVRWADGINLQSGSALGDVVAEARHVMRKAVQS